MTIAPGLNDLPSRLAVSIVLFHSDRSQLDRTLLSLAGQTMPPAIINIHVNEADDDELGTLADLVDPHVVVTSSLSNDGFAAAHDAALARLFDGAIDHVLVLNPDLALQPSALEELVTASRQHSGALVGPVLLLADAASGRSESLIDSLGIAWTRSGRHLDDGQGRPATAVPEQPVRVAGISGAAILVSRAAHDRIVSQTGEFFDADFIAYREDAELAFRAQLLGVESWLVPAAVGLHVRQLRGTSRSMSPAVNRLGVRNRFLIAAKYGRRRPGSGLYPWARDAVVVLGVVLRERSSWSGITDAWRLRRHMRAKGLRVLAAAHRVTQ
jgi:GT2 family glycosyltransferase